MSAAIQMPGKLRQWATRLLVVMLALFLLLSLLPYLIPTRKLTPLLQATGFADSQFAEIEGVRLHYRLFEPDSLPAKGNLLLVHGFAGSTFSWRKNIEYFRLKGYRVLCVDLPPFGYSERQTQSLWFRQADRRPSLIWQLCHQLQPDAQWHLVGHSMGVAFVWQMYQHQPGRVVSMTWVDGLPGFGRVQRWQQQALLAYPPVRRWICLLAEHFYYTPQQFHRLLASAYAQTPDSEAVEGYLAPFLVESTTKAILQWMRRPMIVHTSGQAWEQLPLRLLIIWGKQDSWIPIRHAMRFVQQHSSIAFQSIAKAGHCPMETHPKAFNLALLNFLEQSH